MTASTKKFTRNFVLFILLIDVVAVSTDESVSKNKTESVLSKFVKGKKQAKIMEDLVSRFTLQDVKVQDPFVK